MNRPDNISVYDELDLKLGIKSSLPHVKSTIALAVLLWECADRPAELVYSQQNGDGIVMTNGSSTTCQRSVRKMKLMQNLWWQLLMKISCSNPRWRLLLLLLNLCGN